jgi:L-ascorbate metabolism protein UlaG (beta-lactamase superfamily)
MDGSNGVDFKMIQERKTIKERNAIKERWMYIVKEAAGVIPMSLIRMLYQACSGRETHFMPTPNWNHQVEILNQNEPSITWFGHASFLIRVGGKTILTDPVFKDAIGIYKRKFPLALSKEALKKLNVDVVLISHNHRDHMDVHSLKALSGKPLFFVPKGDGSFLRKKGLLQVREFSHWESIEVLPSVRCTFVPAEHISGRNLLNIGASLCGGWVIGCQEKNIYFAGDSGYSKNMFREIGRAFSIDTAILGIGNWRPEFLFGSQHLTPEKALMAYSDLKAKALIPMHYGSFNFMSLDTAGDNLFRLKEAWKKRRWDPTRLICLNHGDTIEASLKETPDRFVHHVAQPIQGKPGKARTQGIRFEKVPLKDPMEKQPSFPRNEASPCKKEDEQNVKAFNSALQDTKSNVLIGTKWKRWVERNHEKDFKKGKAQSFHMGF